MKRSLNRLMAGFTLVELMIVVVILGILAAVAIPAFTRYIKKSKTAEATRSIASIYTAETTYYAQSGERPDATGALNPPQFAACAAAPAGTPSATRASIVGQWAGGWTAIGFATDTPVYYQYAVTATGSGNAAVATITANGDLDGNGTLSTFSRSLSVNTQGDVVGAPLAITNELE